MGLMEGATFGLAKPEEIAELTGREILQAMIDRRLPAPTICAPLDFLLVEVGDGTAIFEGETSRRILNPFGTVHGGWALTLIDSATTCAALSTLPADTSLTTVETKANFVRPVLPDTGRVRCTATVLARGRMIITTEARVTDPAGKLLAHGGATLMVLAGNARR